MSLKRSELKWRLSHLALGVWEWSVSWDYDTGTTALSGSRSGAAFGEARARRHLEAARAHALAVKADLIEATKENDQ